MVISGWRCIWNQCWRLKKKGVKSIPKTTRVQHYIYIYTLHIFNGNQNTSAGKRIQSTPVCHPETWVQNFVYNGNQNSPTQEQIQFTSASHLSPDPLWANDHFQPENYEQMTTFNLRTMNKWPFSTREQTFVGRKTAWKGAGTKSTDLYDCWKLDQTPFPTGV